MRNTSIKYKFNRTKNIFAITTLAVATTGALFLSSPISTAATSVSLGSADSFAILAGAGITNTGTTTIVGNVGSSPSGTFKGTQTATVFGKVQLANGTALAAQSSALAAYNSAASQPTSSAIVADLGGKTLTPGVYGTASGINITGALTLNGAGDPNAVFIFKAGSTLTTASASNILLTNGATSCNVFWQIGSSAVLGTNSALIGTVLANTSITANTGASVYGGLLALNGTVTLDGNSLTRTPCPPSPIVPVVNFNVCPVFLQEALVGSSTINSLTMVYVGSNVASWSLMENGFNTLLKGEGNPGFVTRSGLGTNITYTQTVVLFSGPNQTGCSESNPATGTTDAFATDPVPEATPTPTPTPTVTPTPTPTVTPTPTPTPTPQVTKKPTGPVSTGDGSLGKRRR